MKVKITKIFNYGCWEQVFETEITMPEAPFIGLRIGFSNDDCDYEITEILESHSYQTTWIYYWVSSASYYIEIREKITDNIRPDELSENKIRYEALGWTMTKDDSKTIMEIQAQQR